MSLAQKLYRYYPDANWLLSGEAYEGLVWVGPGERPAKADLDALPDPKPDLAPLIDAERDRRIASGFTFQGVRYQSRPFDYDNIGGASTAAVAALTVGGKQPGDMTWAGPQPFVWIAEDNSETPMDAAMVIGFGQAAISHRQACIFAGKALKARIAGGEAITDISDDTLWP